jgi:hypothetical protein
MSFYTLSEGRVEFELTNSTLLSPPFPKRENREPLNVVKTRHKVGVSQRLRKTTVLNFE